MCREQNSRLPKLTDSSAVAGETIRAQYLWNCFDTKEEESLAKERIRRLLRRSTISSEAAI